MSNQTQQQIDALIQFINDAEDPGVVTNIVVATVLIYLADKVKTVATTDALSTEVTSLQAADSALSERITTLQTTLNTLMSGNVSNAIESFNEVINFLNEVTDDESLSGLLLQINNNIATKAALDSDTGRLGYSQVPTIMLDSMGFDLDNADDPSTQRQYVSSIGDTTYDPLTGKIVYRKTQNQSVSRNPDARLIYGNKFTGFLYQFTNNAMKIIAGGPKESDSSSALSIVYDGIDTLVISDPASIVTIIVNKSSVSFGDTEVNTEKTFDLVVTGKNLVNAITLALSTPNSPFSLSKVLIPSAEVNQANNVVITYSPTSIGEDEVTITLSSGDISIQVSLSGNAVAQIIPSITLNYGESSATMVAESGQTASTNIPIVGRNLTPASVIAISISGNGITATPQTFVVNENGSVDGTIAIEALAGASGQIVATCGQISSSLNVICSVKERLATGSYWYDEFYRYQVLEDRTKVGISQNPSNKPSGDITLPTSVNDSGKTIYNSNGEEVEANDMTYQVTRIINPDANSSPFLGAQITKVIVPEGYTHLTTRTFDFGASGTGLLKEVYLPSTLVAWGGGWDFRNQPMEKLVIAATQTWGDAGFYFNNPLQYVEFGLGVTNCNKQNMYLNVASGTKVVARPTTPPTVAWNFFGSNYTQGTLYVPSAAKSAYEAASYWSSFSSIKTIEDDLANDLANS